MISRPAFELSRLPIECSCRPSLADTTIADGAKLSQPGLLIHHKG